MKFEGMELLEDSNNTKICSSITPKQKRKLSRKIAWIDVEMSFLKWVKVVIRGG